MISPRLCEAWCVVPDGHQHAHSRSDQTCVSDATTVELYLEDPQPQPGGNDWWTPFVAVQAIAGFNAHPVVGLHVNVPDGDGREVDREVPLTAREARELAAGLLRCAGLVEQAAEARGEGSGPS